MNTNNLTKQSATSISLTAMILSTPLCAVTAAVGPEVVEGELAPYVVVATRTPLGLDRVSPSVSYIGANEMELWQDRSLVDVLQKQVGMPIIPSGTSGSLTSLFTRGTNSNHTSFFLDGRRMNPGFSNQFGIDVLPVSNLASVQMQRGASSVNYGSNGIGGAIDLRTRSGFDVEKATFGAEFELGSNRYVRGAMDAAFSEDDIAFSMTGSWLETDNERANDGFEQRSASSRFDYRISRAFSLELLGLYSEGQKEVPGSLVAPAVDQLNTTETWLISPGVRYATDQFSAHLFYSKTANDFINTQPGQFNEIIVDSDEISLQMDYSLDDTTLLTLGAVYRNDQASNNNVAFFGPPIPYEETQEQVGGFAQLIWMVTSQLELRGGVRYDSYSDFGSEWTSNVEAIYYLDAADLSVFAKYATSYVPPRTSDIAFDSDPVTDPKPESSVSYELGLRQEWAEQKLTAELVFFHNDIEDLLTFDFTGVGFTGFDIKNVNEATTEGVEFSLDYQPTTKLNLGLGYTYLEAIDEQTNARLVRRPRHTLQLTANYQFTDAFRAGVIGTGYFSREDFELAFPFGQVDIEDFFVIGLVADWELSEHWSLFGRVSNLLDESYAPTVGFPALGRAGYLGARWTF